jgi:hypothetical protein
MKLRRNLTRAGYQISKCRAWATSSLAQRFLRFRRSESTQQRRELAKKSMKAKSQSRKTALIYRFARNTLPFLGPKRRDAAIMG